jgi:virginiamycin B lyase
VSRRYYCLALLLYFPAALRGQTVDAWLACGGDYCPATIVAGPDGNLWFTTPTDIGKITTQGDVTFFATPGSTSLYGLAVGPDNNLWFTDPRTSRIGRMTLTGEVTEFPLSSPDRYPVSICAGPDGALWFNEDPGRIGKISVQGEISGFPLPDATTQMRSVAAGADGNLWFDEYFGAMQTVKIGRITPTGTVTEFPVPEVEQLTSGPDGNIWFAEAALGRIGKIMPTGDVTEFQLPPQVYPAVITAGPDGNVWFGFIPDSIGQLGFGRVTPSGNVAIYTPYVTMSPPLSPDFLLLSLASGPDGNLWFSLYNNSAAGCPECIHGPGYVGSLQMTSCFPDANTLCLNNGRFELRTQWTDFQGNTGPGNVVPNVSSSDSGLFWFFGPDNWEMLLKVLNGCAVNDHYWFFGAASTDVGYTIQVTDTQAGTVRTYTNPLGTVSPAITDTGAFGSCP